MYSVLEKNINRYLDKIGEMSPNGSKSLNTRANGGWLYKNNL